MNEYPHTVTIQSKVQTDDGGGGYTEEWVPHVTLEALVVPISGSEFYQAQATQNPVQYDVFIPYREDVIASMRLDFQGKLLQIHAVLPALVDINGDFEKICLKCSL